MSRRGRPKKYNSKLVKTTTIRFTDRTALIHNRWRGNPHYCLSRIVNDALIRFDGVGVHDRIEVVRNQMQTLAQHSYDKAEEAKEKVLESARKELCRLQQIVTRLERQEITRESHGATE